MKELNLKISMKNKKPLHITVKDEKKIEQLCEFIVEKIIGV